MMLNQRKLIRANICLQYMPWDFHYLVSSNHFLDGYEYKTNVE